MRNLLRRSLDALLLRDDPFIEPEPECDCDVCRLVSMIEALAVIRAEEIAALDALYAAPAYGEEGW